MQRTLLWNRIEPLTTSESCKYVRRNRSRVDSFINTNQFVNLNLGPRTVKIHNQTLFLLPNKPSRTDQHIDIGTLSYIEFRVVGLLPHSIITLTNTTFPSNSIMVSRSIVAIKHALTSELHLNRVNSNVVLAP